MVIQFNERLISFNGHFRNLNGRKGHGVRKERNEMVRVMEQKHYFHCIFKEIYEILANIAFQEHFGTI